MSLDNKIRRWPPSSVEGLRGVFYSIDAKVERADREELNSILQANGAVRGLVGLRGMFVFLHPCLLCSCFPFCCCCFHGCLNHAPDIPHERFGHGYVLDLR